jgi:hypothetical protein
MLDGGRWNGARKAVGSWDDGTLLRCGGHGGDATAVLESNLMEVCWRNARFRSEIIPLHRRRDVSMTRREVRITGGVCTSFRQAVEAGWFSFYLTSLKSHVSDTTNAVTKASLILRPDDRTLR